MDSGLTPRHPSEPWSNLDIICPDQAFQLRYRGLTTSLTICIIIQRVVTHRYAALASQGPEGEWMYVFKPYVGGRVLYVKLIVRDGCVVVSFHEDEGEGHEEDE